MHRCLSASLGLTALPDGLKDHEYMAEIVDNMNARHINAARASRSSAQLHTLLFFRTHAGMVADARVLKVQANGLIVLVPRFGIEGPVFFGDDGEANTGVTLNEAKQVRRCCGAGGCAGSLPRADVAGVRGVFVDEWQYLCQADTAEVGAFAGGTGSGSFGVLTGCEQNDVTRGICGHGQGVHAGILRSWAFVA